MFTIGFEKVAVSSDYVLKRIAHRIAPNKAAQPVVRKAMSEQFDMLGLTGMPSKDNPLLRMLVHQVRKDAPKKKMPMAQKFMRKQKRKLLIAGGVAGAGAAGVGAHKYFKNKSEEEKKRTDNLRREMKEAGL